MFITLGGMLALCFVLLVVIFLGPQGESLSLADMLGSLGVVGFLGVASLGFYWVLARGESVKLTIDGISLLRGSRVKRTFTRDAIRFIAVIHTEPAGGAYAFTRRQLTLADAARLNGGVSVGTTMIFVSNVAAPRGDIIGFLAGSLRQPASRRDLITFYPHPAAIQFLAAYYHNKVY